MKKLVYLAAALLLYVNAFAQISYGPRLGANLSTQKWSGSFADAFKLSLKPGLVAGGFVNYRFDPKMAVNVDLVYSNEGTKEKNNITNAKGNFNMNVIRVPITFQYRVIENLHLEAGPSLGLLINVVEKFDGETYKYKDGYKKIDLGATVGAGYDLSLLLKGLSADVRYYYGFMDMMESTVNGGDKFVNRSFTIGVRYALSK